VFVVDNTKLPLLCTPHQLGAGCDALTQQSIKRSCHKNSQKDVENARAREHESVAVDCHKERCG